LRALSLAHTPITAGPYELSDAQWQRIAPMLPEEPGNRSRTGSNNRLFINAVLWVLRSGAAWHDLPERYGNWGSIHKRFTRWAKSGVWEGVFASLAADPDNPYDPTLVRVPPAAAGGKGRPRMRLRGVPEED
jgi:transposase